MESRDKDKFQFKDIKKRTIDTLFGEVTVERRYYKDSNNEFRFLFDEYLNIPANERQSPALKEIALDLVQELPYRKAADKIDKILETSASHTAIFNWVQKEGTKLTKKAETKQLDFFRDGLIPDEKNKDRKKVDQLKKYILKNWEFIRDKKHEQKKENLGLSDEIRNLGAMESNIDKVLANRFKKRGMRWSREGARNLAKI